MVPMSVVQQVGSLGYRVADVVRYTGFLRAKENWKNSGNLSGQGKYFFGKKSEKMKIIDKAISCCL